MLGGALEHQVFEEVREAGIPRRLVCGTHLVPDHVGDHRRPVVGDDHQFEAVGKDVVADIGAGLDFGTAGTGGTHGREGQGQKRQKGSVQHGSLPSAPLPKFVIRRGTL
jgi:hypothetical protein